MLFFGAFLNLSAADIQLYMSASPSNPIIGEEVTWSVISFSSEGPSKYVWNSDATEMPWLYSWAPGKYPFYRTTTMKVTYKTAGEKSVTVTASAGNKEITRTLSLTVVEGRITLLTPNSNEIWEVGKTYPIRWKTEGNVPLVQIGLWDHRYPSEYGNSGEELIVQSTANTGSFSYTVPPARVDGISAGNIGGKNYKVSVHGFNSCFSGFSAGHFTIRLPRKR